MVTAATEKTLHDIAGPSRVNVVRLIPSVIRGLNAQPSTVRIWKQRVGRTPPGATFRPHGD